ncbi:hypothetical protein F5X98DRAFT_247591 [Xylaria grammica]|nr:hypothetical protein F5X98DRAFT_247591 [Xylaria grammica]
MAQAICCVRIEARRSITLMSIAVLFGLRQLLVVYDGMVTTATPVSDSATPNTGWRCNSNDTMIFLFLFFFSVVTRYLG